MPLLGWKEPTVRLSEASPSASVNLTFTRLGCTRCSLINYNCLICLFIIIRDYLRQRKICGSKADAIQIRTNGYSARTISSTSHADTTGDFLLIEGGGSVAFLFAFFNKIGRGSTFRSLAACELSDAPFLIPFSSERRSGTASTAAEQPVSFTY